MNIDMNIVILVDIASNKSYI